LFFNHKYWKTAEGNEITIGGVTSASVAKTVNHTDEAWKVVTEDGEELGTISKAKTPDLAHGSRGLWVEAEVDVDEVWEMVEKGKLNTFSWRGVVKMVEALIGNIKKTIANEIDLWEVSLVFVPDQFAAMFEVAKGLEWGSDIIQLKEADGDVYLPVQRIHFSEEFFTEESALEWLEKNGLNSTELTSAEGELVSVQHDASSFTEPVFSVYVQAGITAFVGELMEMQEKNHSRRSSQMVKEQEKNVEETPEETAEETVEETSEETETSEEEKNAEEGSEETGKTAEQPEETEETEEETEEETSEGLEDQQKDVFEQAKGAVADILSEMDKEKYARMQEVFKMLNAFDEAVWNADNTPDELSALVAELAMMLGTVEVKTAEKSADSEADEFARKVGEIAAEKNAQAFTDAVKPLIDAVNAVQTAITETQKGASVDEDGKQTEVKEKSTDTDNHPLSGILKDYQALKEKTAELEQRTRDISKTAVAPKQSEEDEPKEKDDDPNACFSPNWPFGK
jgi:hypothetical protein